MTDLLASATGERASRSWLPLVLLGVYAAGVLLFNVRRHDASINFAAHLNRAIFWFHPLAWWLERKLAVTAEHACDEAAAHAIGAPSRYAEIVVEMADVVRRNRGRLVWQAVGVNGAGLLDGRIDRLLRGDAFASGSRGKKIAAGIGCVLALATVIACRQQISATPLREDPEQLVRPHKRNGGGPPSDTETPRCAIGSTTYPRKMLLDVTP